MKKQLKKRYMGVWTGRLCFSTNFSSTLLSTGKSPSSIRDILHYIRKN